jgi:superfamily II DNA or RNA helicase
LRKVANEESLIFAEWNGHKHEPIPDTDNWLYFVQYNGSEGWNCIKTNVIIFYSLNYSYRTMKQAAGRIDRSNTPFKHLYFYRLKSNSPIDNGIAYAVKRKKDFNESSFIGKKFNNEEVARKTQLIIEGERE